MNRRSFAMWTLPGKRRNVRSASGSGETSRGPGARIPLSRPSARSASIFPARVVSSISPEMVSRTYPPASTKTSVGQERTAKRSQVSCSESTTTGWVTPLRSTARLTFCGSFSDELGRVDADDDDRVLREALFDAAQDRQDVHAVDAAVGPEVEDRHPPAQVSGHAQRPARVDPGEPGQKFGAAHAGCRHPGNLYP